MRILRIAFVSLVALIAAMLWGRNIPFASAADHPPEAKPAAAKPEKGQGLQFEIVAADSPVDELLAEMNGSTGAKKIDAMAALLNRLVQERKSKGRFSGVMRLQLGNDGPDKASGHAASPSDASKGSSHEKGSDAEKATGVFKAAPEWKTQAEQSVAEARLSMENAVAKMRTEVERAVAQAHEEVEKAHAERDEARREAERAKAEARELAKKLNEEQRAANK